MKPLTEDELFAAYGFGTLDESGVGRETERGESGSGSPGLAAIGQQTSAASHLNLRVDERPQATRPYYPSREVPAVIAVTCAGLEHAFYPSGIIDAALSKQRTTEYHAPCGPRSVLAHSRGSRRIWSKTDAKR